MTKKRPREKKDTITYVVEIFEDLANENEEIRLRAAKRLLSGMQQDADLPELLRRLFRGLCSGRKAARLGFSVALTEFLVQHASPQAKNRGFSVNDILEQLKDQTQPPAKTKGQEERDYHFGKLFGAEAIIKSKIIFFSEDQEAWNQVLDIIFGLYSKRTWLREQCTWILSQAFLTLKSFPSPEPYAESIINRVQASGWSKTPEGIVVWIMGRQTIPNMDLPKHVFHRSDPLDKKEKIILAKALKGSPSTEELEAGIDANLSKGSWSNKLHFAWDIVFGATLKGVPERVDFSDLWKEAVDGMLPELRALRAILTEPDGLFAQSSSSERKYWGFQLMERYLTIVPVELLPVVLGQNSVRCLVNQLAKNDRELHNIANKVLGTIVQCGRLTIGASPIIVKTLIDTRDCPDFDGITKQKALANLMREVSVDELDQIVDILRVSLNSPRTTEQRSAASTRRVIADHMLHLVRSLSTRTTEELSGYRRIVGTILESLTEVAYLTKIDIPVTEDTRVMILSRILSCLGHTMSMDPDPSLLPYQIAKALLGPFGGNKAQVSLKADDRVYEIICSAGQTLDKIHERTEPSDQRGAKSDKAFVLLFSLTIIQAFSGEADAVNVLEELQDCYKSLLKTKSTGSQNHGSEALVEIVLTMISKPSALFRRLAQQVFASCSPVIDADGLRSMFNVLETRESLVGQRELFDEEGEDGGSVASIDASDVEEIVNSNSSDSKSSSGNSQADNSSVESDDEVVEFDKKLAEALGTRRADEDLAIQECESSDEEMDDEQMEALEPLVTSIFKDRQKTTTKKLNKDAKETIIQLKCRVLELLETFVKKQHESKTTLVIIKPLLVLMRSTNSKLVSEKAHKVLKDYMKAYKLKTKGENTEVDMVMAKEIFHEVHNLVTMPGSNAYLNACSQASLLLVKVMLNGGSRLEDAWADYASTGEKMARDPACKVSSSFFQDWFNWLVSAKQTLNKWD